MTEKDKPWQFKTEVLTCKYFFVIYENYGHLNDFRFCLDLRANSCMCFF